MNRKQISLVFLILAVKVCAAAWLLYGDIVVQTNEVRHHVCRHCTYITTNCVDVCGSNLVVIWSFHWGTDYENVPEGQDYGTNEYWTTTVFSVQCGVVNQDCGTPYTNGFSWNIGDPLNCYEDAVTLTRSYAVVAGVTCRLDRLSLLMMSREHPQHASVCARYCTTDDCLPVACQSGGLPYYWTEDPQPLGMGTYRRWFAFSNVSWRVQN